MGALIEVLVAVQDQIFATSMLIRPVPIPQSYSPRERQGLWIPTTIHGTPAARALSMAATVQLYRGVPGS